MTYFNYYTNTQPELSNGEKILSMPGKITEKKELFKACSVGLNFPSYFGNNWDAFDDCLMDLSFVEEKNICIIHQDIPFLANAENRRIYVECLFDTVRHWWEFPEHKFFVYFPEECRDEIIKIVETREYD